MQIKKIERVQNPVLWASYAAARALLRSKWQKGLDNGALRMNKSAPGSGACIEHALWHGTRAANPMQLARSANGFCATYAHASGSCGAGVYFASTPEYSSNGYAYAPGGGVKQLVLADVLLGAILVEWSE